MSAVAPAPRRSAFLRAVRRAVLEDFEPELELIERLAVLRAAGFNGAEIRRRVDVSSIEFTRATARLKHAAERLDAGD